MLLVDDPASGVPGLTDDQSAARALLSRTLGRVRQVPGVGRVLLFRPAEAEARLAAMAFGFRLWPQAGETPGQRFANAFRQGAELGYEGALVLRVDVPTVPVELLTQAVTHLEDSHGVVMGDGRGGIALLALQEPQPTLFSGSAVPTYDELRTRASQQRLRVVELPEHEGLTADTLGPFLAAGARS